MAVGAGARPVWRPTTLTGNQPDLPTEGLIVCPRERPTGPCVRRRVFVTPSTGPVPTSREPAALTSSSRPS
jgi:hypothetical protein